MKLDDGRIEVEPLDDIRLSNIERRVVARVGDQTARVERVGPRRFAAMAMVAVTVAVAGVGGWLLRGRGDARAPVVATTTITTTTPIEVATGADGSTLQLGDATITSAPNTAFAVTRPDGKVLVALARGRVELDVAKRTGRPPLIVRAGDTDVIVVGTRFSVDFGDGTGDVDVNVTEGVVRVERKAVAAVPVAAGQAWTRAGGVIGTVAATATTPGYDTRLGAGPDVLRDRVAAVPDARVPVGERVAKRPARVEAPAAKPVGAGEAPAADLRAMVARQRVEPALDVGTADGTRAMAKYRELLTTEKGAAAAQAFYSMAVTQHLKLGRNADALSTLDAFFRRFNDSEFHTAAAWLRVRIACSAVIDARCRAAAEGYLRRTTDGVAARVAELITLTP